MNYEKEIKSLEKSIEWCKEYIESKRTLIDSLEECYCCECADRRREIADARQAIEFEFTNIGALETRISIYKNGGK